jgi:hypothetical protein
LIILDALNNVPMHNEVLDTLKKGHTYVSTYISNKKSKSIRAISYVT